MLSKRSCFNATLYRKNLTRFWPAWALYLVMWLFLFPLSLLTNYRKVGDYSGGLSGPAWFADVVVPDWATGQGVVIALLFGLLSAMLVFSYLYQSKSAGMLHALPIRREGLFLTNYLSGYSFLALPLLLVFLLTLGAEALCGHVNAGALGMWLAVQLLISLFFYSFAVFCGMFTGHILALPAFYGVLNLLSVGLAFLLNELFRFRLLGYQRSDGLQEAAGWLSPAYKLIEKLRLSMDYGYANDRSMLTSTSFQGLQYAILYAVVGLILTGAALAVYRRRHLESAGDVVSVGLVRPVFKYGVTLCAALAGGVYLYAWFQDAGGPGLLLYMAVCAAAGYFVAEMLLKKSFRVLRSWRGCLAALAALSVGFSCLELDVTGFERRVPDPALVTEVQFWGVTAPPHDSGDTGKSLYLSDQEVIQALVRLHQTLAEEGNADWDALYEQLSSGGDQYVTATLPDGTRLTSVQRYGLENLSLSYTLANGGTMYRVYNVPVTEELLSRPDSSAAQLLALLNRPEVVMAGYFPENELEGARLINVSITNRYASDRGGYDEGGVSIGGDHPEEILAAVRSDMAAGRLGRRYLLDSEERLTNCYYNDLRFTFQRENVQNNEPSIVEVTVTLQDSATETMALLERLGVPDRVELLTQAQIQDMDARDGDGKSAEPVY